MRHIQRNCALLLALLMLASCGDRPSESVAPSPSPAVETTAPPAPERVGLFDPLEEIRAEAYDSRRAQIYRLEATVPVEDDEFRFVTRGAELFDSLGMEAYDEEELALRQEWAEYGGIVELRLVQGDTELIYVSDNQGIYLKLNGEVYKITENYDQAKDLMWGVGIQCLSDGKRVGYFQRDNEKADYALSNGLELHMSYGQITSILGEPDSMVMTVKRNGDGTARAEYVLSYGEDLRLSMYYTGSEAKYFETRLPQAALGKVEIFGEGVQTAGGVAVGMDLDKLLSCCGFDYAYTDFTSIGGGEYDAWCGIKKDMFTDDAFPAELLFFITDEAVSGIVLQDYILCSEPAASRDSSALSCWGSSDDSAMALVVTDTGELYARGNNHYEELFFGDDGDYDWIHIMSGVKQFYGGFLCFYALTSDGELYGWGMSGGEAFLEEPSGFRRTYRQHIMDDVIDFCTNTHEYYILRSDGSLWGWGAGHDGIEHIMDNVASVCLCWARVFAIDRDGDVYAWEANRLDDAEWSATEPEYLLSGIRDISGIWLNDLQGNFTYYYELLTNEGALFVCSKNAVEWDGTLTEGTLQSVATATDVSQVCGNGYIKNDGSFWRWIRGEKGLEAQCYAEHVLAAGTTTEESESSVINEKNELLFIDMEGTVIRRWSMDIFS